MMQAGNILNKETLFEVYCSDTTHEMFTKKSKFSEFYSFSTISYDTLIRCDLTKVEISRKKSKYFSKCLFDCISYKENK